MNKRFVYFLFFKHALGEWNPKLQGHEKQKTRTYKEDIGKYSNMTYAIFEYENYYICYDGRQLCHIRTEKENRMEMPRRLMYMDVRIAADASTKSGAFINTMSKRSRLAIKS